MNKRGLSGVITTVMFIAIGLVIAGIVTVVVLNLISHSSQQTYSSFSAIGNRVTINKVLVKDDHTIDVILRREPGGDDFTKMKITVFSDNYSKEFYTDGLKELESKTINLDYPEFVKGIRVTPVFGSGIASTVIGEFNYDIDEADGKNLIPNWDMSDDADWTDPPEQELMKDPNNFTFYAHVAPGPIPDGHCTGSAKTTLIPINPNKKYKFSIWIKTNDSDIDPRFGFFLYDSSGQKVSGYPGWPLFKKDPQEPNKWIKWTAYLTPLDTENPSAACEDPNTNSHDWCLPSNAAYIRIRFHICNSESTIGAAMFMYPKMEEVPL